MTLVGTKTLGVNPKQLQISKILWVLVLSFNKSILVSEHITKFFYLASIANLTSKISNFSKNILSMLSPGILYMEINTEFQSFTSIKDPSKQLAHLKFSNLL